MPILVIARNLTRKSYWVAVLLVCIAGNIRGQSADIAMPSPVRTNEVTGAIPARDIGDARLTDHFYAFSGAPGDLLITVDSRNLNGDIDVFTSEGLRPLLKFTVYAGSSSPITKSIYFRRREDLILRVEGRTPNDDDATYRLHFGGSFEPITSGPLLAESENPSTQPTTPPASTSRGKTGRRVSSVGARIEEPPSTEVAREPAVNTGSGKEGETEPAKPGGASSTRSRGRGRRRVPAKPAPTTEAANKSSEAEDKPSETEEKSAAKEPAEQPKEQPAENPGAVVTPAPSRRTSGRRTTTRRGAKLSAAAEPESGPRLIIETSDGTLINRYMNTVRRVTVENGWVVVVGKDGAISRIQLLNVVRMSIGP